jgi:hypothetical protein
VKDLTRGDWLGGTKVSFDVAAASLTAEVRKAAPLKTWSPLAWVARWLQGGRGQYSLLVSFEKETTTEKAKPPGGNTATGVQVSTAKATSEVTSLEASSAERSLKPSLCS